MCDKEDGITLFFRVWRKISFVSEIDAEELKTKIRILGAMPAGRDDMKQVTDRLETFQSARTELQAAGVGMATGLQSDAMCGAMTNQGMLITQWYHCWSTSGKGEDDIHLIVEMGYDYVKSRGRQLQEAEAIRATTKPTGHRRSLRLLRRIAGTIRYLTS